MRAAIEGCTRFLKRVWRLVEEFDEKKVTGDPHLRLRHKTIKKVSGDLDRMAFNTAVAAMMEYLNVLTSSGATREDLLTLIKLVGPFAPIWATRRGRSWASRPSCCKSHGRATMRR